ncbi:Nramp family divalent metal transporter [Planctomicrobium sp. SH661]|uniref:Nramp family divalent metal transporter n=1 Tax=Planctomicrobium sp. SH661 TaxID=3448124 RepID=UPI003F5B41B8
MSNAVIEERDENADHGKNATWQAPYPGSKKMPQWTTGTLGDAPHFGWRQLPMLLGPGLVLGAAAVGGGEWLTGPVVTAKYGGALLWLATLSILGQVFYNIEISRYTLYCGEPIFTGKFRTFPGPFFWPFLYLLLDFGSFLPYLCSNAAVPLLAMYLGRLPDLKTDGLLLRIAGCGILLLTMLPLIFGGKVYSSLKYLMTGKLVLVMGFLMFLALGFSTWDTWREIAIGFVSFGTLPFQPATPDGPSQLLNVPWMLWHGQTLPPLDLSLVGMITAMAAIAGNGGLTNTPISNFTRDQGWGMGKSVGAIPSIVGGRSIQLSHVGKVFQITADSLRSWYGWMRHVHREQILVWLPACFFGMALPSMLSMQFLPRGVLLKDQWLAAGMTADGVAKAVGETMGPLFWGLTLFCGFLILTTSAIVTMDGALRRWIDVYWTASSHLRKLDTHWIGKLYFGSLCMYGLTALVLLNVAKPDRLLVWTTNLYNYALGFSCFHVLAINSLLLPKEIQPSWWRRAALSLAGTFFTCIAVITTLHSLGYFKS